MIQLVLPFIPPSANHTQKHALSGNSDKKRIMRYNTPTYNAFKERVVVELGKDNLQAFTAFLASPHKVTISVHSPRFITKKGTPHKKMDLDNFIKPLLDAIYKPLEANDALVMQITASKHHAVKEYTVIEWEEYTKDDALKVFPYNPRRDKQKLLHYAFKQFMTIGIEHEDLMYLTGDPSCSGILEVLDTYGLCPDDEDLEAM
jgi:Holliday junction resolvase RusA-like endonuclease